MIKQTNIKVLFEDSKQAPQTSRETVIWTRGCVAGYLSRNLPFASNASAGGRLQLVREKVDTYEALTVLYVQICK